MLGGLTACSLLIPENPSAPRYNKVEGEMHTPQLNRGMPTSTMAAPVTPVATQSIPNLPPVDPSVQARAQQEIAALNATGRSMPVENQNLVNSGAVPDLSSVPPRPVTVGAASAESRLAQTRTELEQDRTQAVASKDQLMKDAQAEPSMLSPMPAPMTPPPAPKPIAKAPVAPEPTGVVPPPEPVAVAPIAPPAGSGYIAAVPPSPMFAPPPPMNPSAMPPAAPAPLQEPVPVISNVAPAPHMQPAIAVAPLPAPLPSGKEPIVLRPPVGMAAVAPEPMVFAAPTPTSNMAPAASGGFDPMASVDTRNARAGTLYQPTGYLPTSRYADRR